MGTLHAGLLIAFAALTATFEGPAEILGVLALACTLLIRRPRRLPLPIVALLVWALAGCVGWLNAVPIGTRGMLRPLLALSFGVGYFGIARASDGTLRKMAWAFAIGILLNGLYGYVQILFVDPPFETLLRGRLASAHLADPQNEGRLRMATGLFYNRLKLAHVGAVGLGLMGLIAVYVPRRRALAIAGGLLFAGALFMTYRRAAPIALLGSAVLVAFLLGRARVAASIAGIGAAIVGLFSFTGYGRERLGTAGNDLTERLDIYGHALRMFADHPLFGVGHGGYQSAVAQYAPNMAPDLMTSPHNLALQVLTETGVVGFGAFAAFAGWAVVSGARRLRAERERRDAETIAHRFSWLGVVIILLLGGVHAVLFHSPVALLYWTLLGVCAAQPSYLAAGSGPAKT